ncbi:hypothetical protein [Streptomyces sp. S1D4-14]|uniref:hypothetical protein n=1 Tax=Streptomyces sp. S1D4-14 TaxID=2594461 RepID=UPI001162BFF8|nr:hypothetical protein [Streptomyces sp. S1D4-14]QDN64381.1 hypothetical protein FNV66_00675 [Streptomyces sp. S1D4-14]
MSSIGTNSPDNPFSAQGRAAGKSAADLRRQGIDSNGHPLPSQPANGQANGAGQRPSRPAGTRGQNIAQLANSIGSLELSNQDDLHAFCEAYRAVLNYLAVSAKMAEGQLKAAARAQARQTNDGWMGPMQAAKLATTLRRVGKDLDKLANSCVSGAADAVKAWRRFETLLDELENDGGRGGIRRPGGRNNGFSVV